MTPERTFSDTETMLIIKNFQEKFCKKLLYTTKLHSKNDDPYPTYTTFVTNPKGKFIIRGNGKGIGEQSRLSSVFEAVEHTFYESYFMSNVIKWKTIKPKKFNKLKENLETYYKSTPIFENIKKVETEIKIPATPYKNLRTDEIVLFPLFMYGPSYPFVSYSYNDASNMNSIYLSDKKVKAFLFPHDKIENYEALNSSIKYSSSVGGAAGIDFKETFLHALNEVIERDSTSEFLLKALVNNDYNDYCFVEKKSLNAENQKIVDYIEKNYSVSLQITNITAKLGIPTILVYDKENKYGEESPLTGYGTSLNFDYAVQRALLEYKQTIDLVIFDKSLPQEENLKQFIKNNTPEFFSKIYYFSHENLKKLNYKNQEDVVKNCITHSELSPDKMLNFLIRHLENNGYDILYNQTQIKVGHEKILFLKVLVPKMCDITDPGPLRLPTEFKINMIKGINVC